MNADIREEIRNNQKEFCENKIKKLEQSKQMISQINRNFSHDIMLPLNSVCMVPSKIIETNHVRQFMIYRS